MKISEKELLSDLKRVCNLLGKRPTGTEYERHGKYSVFPYKSKKKWTEWVNMAFDCMEEFNGIHENIKPKHRSPSFEELKEDLSKLDLGHKPSQREYLKYGNYSIESFYKYMNWREWQELCFPDLKATNTLKINVSDEKNGIMIDIVRVGNLLGKSPTSRDYLKYGNFSKCICFKIRKWHEWLDLCFPEKAPHIKPNEKITNEDLIYNLLLLQEKFNRVPQKEDLQLSKGSKYSINAYKRAFGNLANALLAAEMRPHQIRGLSNQDYIEDLQRVYKLLGHTPSMEEFNKYQQTCSWVTVYNAFGSWTKALKAANIPIKIFRNVSKQDILDALQIWYNQNDQETSCLEYWKIRKAKDRGEFPYSCNTIRNKFKLPWEDIMRQIDSKYTTKDPFIGRGCFEGEDGNIYLSSIEKEVGDILCKLQNNGEIETYEYEALVCPEKSWTCDFLINNEIWIEIDGMRNNRKDPYNLGNNDKIQYYIDNNFNYKIISYITADVNKVINKIIGVKDAIEEEI